MSFYCRASAASQLYGTHVFARLLPQASNQVHLLKRVAPAGNSNPGCRDPQTFHAWGAFLGLVFWDNPGSAVLVSYLVSKFIYL